MSYVPLFPGYRPTTLIGKGSSAQVYLAVQESLERQVALKVLKLTDGQRLPKAFLRESRLLAQLHHPHIIPIYDIGQGDGHLFIAMEYIPGGTLRDRMRMGLRVTEALKVMRELTAALAFAHGKGLVHRDIKPDNVMLREDNSVVLMDFGITLDISRDEPQPPQTILGSPNYMSPEHHQGQPLDGRSDLYSLGVVFYQMLTGKLPFTGDSPRALAEQKLRGTADPLPARLQALQGIVSKLLENNPDLRYQSALQLLQDLKSIRLQTDNAPEPQEAAMTTTPSAPRPAAPSERHQFSLHERRYWTLTGKKTALDITSRTDDFLVFDGHLTQLFEALTAANTRYGRGLQQLTIRVTLHPWIQARVRDRLKHLRQNQGMGFLKRLSIQVELFDDTGQPLEQFVLAPER